MRRADILVVRAQPRTHQRRSCFDPPAAAGTPGINFGEPTSFSSAVFGLTPNGTGAGPMVVSSKPNGALGVSGGTEASNDQQAKLDALEVRNAQKFSNAQQDDSRGTEFLATVLRTQHLGRVSCSEPDACVSQT